MLWTSRVSCFKTNTKTKEFGTKFSLLASNSIAKGELINFTFTYLFYTKDKNLSKSYITQLFHKVYFTFLLSFSLYYSNGQEGCKQLLINTSPKPKTLYALPIILLILAQTMFVLFFIACCERRVQGADESKENTQKNGGHTKKNFVLCKN